MFGIFLLNLIVLVIVILVVTSSNPKNNEKNINIIQQSNNPTAKVVSTYNSNNHLQYTSKYITNNTVMTKTEFAFYKDLKEIANKYSLDIFPQVDLKSIVKQKYRNDYSSLNKINRKSIDYTIIRNDTGLIVCCIELDDSSHLKADRKKNDNFKNQVFKEVNIPLIRVIPKNLYTTQDLEELEKQIIICMNDRQNT